MWNNFIFQNLHFTISLLTSLACLLTAWLYLDSSRSTKTIPPFLNFIGFLLLSVGFLLDSISPQGGLFSKSLLPNSISIWLPKITFGLALIFVIVSFIKEPIQKKPD